MPVGSGRTESKWASNCGLSAMTTRIANKSGFRSMSTKAGSKSANLRTLIHRQNKVLAVLHPPTAAHARIMEKAGCEALFVGTGGVVGAYTGLAEVGTAAVSECVAIPRWVCERRAIPVTQAR